MHKKEEPVKPGGIDFLINLLLGGFIGIFIVMLLFVPLSFLVSGGMIPEKFMEWLCIVCCLAGGFGGSVVAVRRHGARALPVGVATGIVMFCITIVAASFTGAESIVGGITLGVFFAASIGGGAGGMFCAQKKLRRK